MAPVCGCTLDIYRYRECRHFDNHVKHVCWRADFRTKSGCLGLFFPCGKPRKVKHSLRGSCDDCRAYFAMFGDLADEVKRSFLAYKETRGWQKKRVKPENLQPTLFLHPGLLEAIAKSDLGPPLPRAPFPAQSPMRADDLLPPPPPAVRSTRSGERRAATPFEDETKPVSECSQQATVGGEGEEAGYELMEFEDEGETKPVYEIPRGASTSPCGVVRHLTREAERLFPNPESPGYPGVPKLSAPPKRRLPRAAALSPPPAPLVAVPAVIVPSDAKASALVRSLALDMPAARSRPTSVSSAASFSVLCDVHGKAYDFGCADCRDALFRERGAGGDEAKASGADVKKVDDNSNEKEAQDKANKQPELRRRRRLSVPLWAHFANPELAGADWI